MTSYNDTPNPKVVTVMGNSFLLPSLLLIPILILLFPAVLLLLLVSFATHRSNVDPQLWIQQPLSLSHKKTELVLITL